MYELPNGQKVCRIGSIVHELYDVLCEEINNKPRVTKNKVVIAKQKNRNK